VSSLNRPLAGEVLIYDLTTEHDAVLDASILDRTGRNARTLVKDHGLRVTLVTVAPGGSIAEHTAEGPISIQVTDGEVLLEVGNDEHHLGPGTLVSLAPGVVHGVSSRAGGTFLLPVCHTSAD